jgi:hypothetical protein
MGMADARWGTSIDNANPITTASVLVIALSFLGRANVAR